MQKPVDEMLTLVKEKLSAQLRRNGDSNALHAQRVRAILEGAAQMTGEIPSDMPGTVVCAALGHDLLEDSDVTEEAIERIVGPDALEIIKELTNQDGDVHTEGYIQQMTMASEEARLIKYADLIDNTLHASFDAHGLGHQWMTSYFLPIIDPMAAALDATSFMKFPRTAALLRHMRKIARQHLEVSICVQ